MYRVYAESCSFNIDYTIAVGSRQPNFELGFLNFDLFSASPAIANYSIILNWQFWQKDMFFDKKTWRQVSSYQFKDWIIQNAPWRTIQNSKLLIPNSDSICRPLANIVQTVKTCYKIKIGFRDFASRFSAVLLRLWHPNLSIQPLLHSNSSPIRVQ